MSTADFSVFFALLSLACWAGTVAVWVLWVIVRFRPESEASVVVSDVERLALWLAWVVALVTTLGSLYFSEIAHYIPCKLCWYLRIAIYPLSIVLFVAALRRDRRIGWYVAPVASVGALFAVYQTQLQAFPHQHSSFCAAADPCTVRYVWEFGFVSLPFMALAALVFVITMVVAAAKFEPDVSDVEEES